MAPLGESSTNAAGKKRRTNVATACLNCRRRKARCDGEKPTCKACSAISDTCEWAEEEDGRKSVNRQYVNSLKDRIRTLEAALKEKGQDLSPMPDEADEEEEDTLADVSKSVLHLHMGEAGEEVHFHGPTSAYAHLAQVQLSVEAAAEAPIAPIGHSHDYRRFLPPSVPISHAEHTAIIDRFFRYYASWCQRAVPNLFHQDMIRAITLPPNTPLPRFTHYSPFLHNTILAMALRWSDDAGLNTPRNRMTFAAAAEMYLGRELPRPTLATVQGLALKSSYHSTLGDHTGGWAYFGMADRAAQSLGLNIDCSALVQSGQMSEQEMLLRRNTFWSIFTQEHMWSVYLGRPQPVPEYSVPLPTVDKQLDEMQWTWDDTSLPGIPGPKQDCLFSTAFVETTKLSLIIKRVMASLYSFRSEKSHKDRVVAELGLALDAWNDQLAAGLTLSGHSLKNALPPIIMLQLAREWVTILIYRPFYRPVVNTVKMEREKEKEDTLYSVAVKRCDRAALRINSLLGIYSSRFGLRFSPPTLFNITFTAGTTHLLAAVRHRTNKVRETAINGARECIGYLYSIGESWPAARHKGDILSKLVEDYNIESTVEPEPDPDPIVVLVNTASENQEQEQDRLPGQVQGERTGRPSGQVGMAPTAAWSPSHHAGPSRAQQIPQAQQLPQAQQQSFSGSWSPSQAGPSSRAQQIPQGQPQSFSGSFDDSNAFQIPSMGMANGGLEGGWESVLEPTASLSTSPTFDPSTWDLLQQTGSSDQNSMLTRLLAQMSSHAAQQPTFFDGSGSFQGQQGQTLRPGQVSTQAPPMSGMGPATSMGMGMGMDNRRTADQGARARDQGQEYFSQVPFRPQAASPPFHLDVDAALLNDLFASYNGSSSFQAAGGAGALDGSAPMAIPASSSGYAQHFSGSGGSATGSAQYLGANVTDSSFHTGAGANGNEWSVRGDASGAGRPAGPAANHSGSGSGRSYFGSS